MSIIEKTSLLSASTSCIVDMVRVSESCSEVKERTPDIGVTSRRDGYVTVSITSLQTHTNNNMIHRYEDTLRTLTTTQGTTQNTQNSEHYQHENCCRVCNCRSCTIGATTILINLKATGRIWNYNDKKLLRHSFLSAHNNCVKSIKINYT